MKMSLVPFRQLQNKLKETVKWSLREYSENHSLLILTDKDGKESHLNVQYDKETQQVYPLPPPKVLNLKGKIHTFGSDLSSAPDGLLYIGRQFSMGGWRLQGSKWANPFNLKSYPRGTSLPMYRQYIIEHPELLSNLHELSGKTLACWCHPEPCHGDVLIELFKEYLQ